LRYFQRVQLTRLPTGSLQRVFDRRGSAIVLLTWAVTLFIKVVYHLPAPSVAAVVLVVIALREEDPCIVGKLACK